MRNLLFAEEPAKRHLWGPDRNTSIKDAAWLTIALENHGWDSLNPEERNPQENPRKNQDRMAGIRRKK